MTSRMAGPPREIEGFTDEDRRHFEFVRPLIHISDSLTKKETDDVKIYCAHVIPKGMIKGLKRAVDIFLKLKEIGKINQENLDFIEEVLEMIGRRDLARDVLRPAQQPDRMIPENPELQTEIPELQQDNPEPQPGPSHEEATAEGPATSNIYTVVHGHSSMTQETVDRHRQNIASACNTRRSQVKFRGYKKHKSILVHFSIPRENTAVLRHMADHSDPRLVYMGIKSLQIDAEVPIKVQQEAPLYDIKRQLPVDDIEVGCSTRTRRQRVPQSWTRLAALNLFSDALPLHLQAAASLEYQGFSYSLVRALVQKDRLREHQMRQAIQNLRNAEVDSNTLRQKAEVDSNTLRQKAEVDSNTIMTLRSKLNITENRLKEALETIEVLEENLTQRKQPSRRVQVHSTEGVYVRHFPTVVPGTEDKDMQPHDVCMDGNGTLWVVGWGETAEHVVQYSTDGTAMEQFDLEKRIYFRGITVDMRTNHILMSDPDNGEVHVFRPDGSLVRTVRHPRGGMTRPRYVTVDGEGNILVSDWGTHCVYVYDESGKLLFQFGGKGSGEGQMSDPQGICTDSSGHILVADFWNKRVQIFTRHGEFVRTFHTGFYSEGLAVGPEGQLVVTNHSDHAVTVYPKYLSYST
uniref:DED domain-containing protein n=1 Tax=Branchiostoma floridae TaxID=7739 RepID=C3ZU65_BRAFL|eukprot:XP_002587940.1 hypothetical protein BRAFLDRAFT_87328 [Branchiostoma floridae]